MREISFKESGGVEGNRVQQFIYRVPNLDKQMSGIYDVTNIFKQTEFVILVSFGVLLITSFFPIEYTVFASQRNETSLTSDSLPRNDTRIVLVHGAGSDGSM